MPGLTKPELRQRLEEAEAVNETLRAEILQLGALVQLGAAVAKAFDRAALSACKGCQLDHPSDGCQCHVHTAVAAFWRARASATWRNGGTDGG